MATLLRSHSAEAGGNPSPRQAGFDREALLEVLRTRTFKRGVFTLASGRRSRIYFNLKATMLHPVGAAQCARGIFQLVRGLDADYVGGLEMGAVPLSGAVAALSHDLDRPVAAIFVRKKAKEHGTALMIEGLDDDGGETLRGKRVVLIDDVATTGKSILQAVDEIARAGGRVSDAIVILDREEGATALLAAQDIRLHTLFTASDLGVTDQDRRPLD